MTPDPTAEDFLRDFNEARDGTPLPFDEDEPPDGLSDPDESKP